MSTVIIDKIKKELEQLDTTTAPKEVGVVVSVGDGIAEIEGLSQAQMMEMVSFDTQAGATLESSLKKDEALFGLVLNLEEDTVKVVILGDSGLVKEGMSVSLTGKLLSVPVGAAIVGRVVDALGTPIDGKGAIATDKNMPIERVAYGVMDRSSVNEPIHTGIKAID